MILTLFPTKGYSKRISELIDGSNLEIELFNFTGGKTYKIFKKYKKSYKCNLIDEFKANIKGTEFLFQHRNNKPLPECLLINIGTGTSIVFYKKSFNHIGGTALGGGFFMGLTKLLYNLEDYEKAIEIAKTGNRYNVDLKVSDIYESQDKRVDNLFREFTASSLGKICSDIDINSVKIEDTLNSIINLIGENIGLISSSYAKNYQIKNLVYCGGFLIKNTVLKRILKLISKINSQKAIFLQNSEFNGVIGALLH